MSLKHPATPDGHYFVVRGLLWRCRSQNCCDIVAIETDIKASLEVLVANRSPRSQLNAFKFRCLFVQRTVP